MNWFKYNHMIVNPGKFQAIIFDKHKGNDHTIQLTSTNQKETKAVSKVKLVGIEISDKLNFNHHINNICKSVSNQYLLGFKGKKVLVNTFLMSNFNYYSLLWNFSGAQSLNEIEYLQKSALRFFLNDYDSTYEDLLEKCGYSSINLRRQRTLCIDIYKTLNKLNSGYMNDIFKLRNTGRLTREKDKLNLEIPKPNQATFGTRSISSYGPKIGDALP